MRRTRGGSPAASQNRSARSPPSTRFKQAEMGEIPTGALEVEIEREPGLLKPRWKELARSPIQSPGGAFNLKGVLTLFIQNNTNMPRSSKSIVVKRRGHWRWPAHPRRRPAGTGRRARGPGLALRSPPRLPGEGRGGALSALGG